jgi:hypothetical protein
VGNNVTEVHLAVRNEMEVNIRKWKGTVVMVALVAIVETHSVIMVRHVVLVNRIVEAAEVVDVQNVR